MGNNTFIFYSEQYHWAWFIPLSPDIVSVGFVLPKERYKEVGKTPEEVYAWGVEHLNPDLRSPLHDSEQVEPMRVISDYSYRIEPFVGNGWMCVGDAHRFADPIFSFGVAFAMHEARAAAEAIVEVLSSNDWREPLARYTRYSDTAQDVVFDFIHYFWKYPTFFGYQMRGKRRKEVIRLFAGDCYKPDDLQIVKIIRERLAVKEAAAMDVSMLA
jgi:1H-pyrrole-2-carbonyl-[peptidyl-carrier protein] brominase